MSSFLERYQAGDHVAVWDDLTALGAGVRHELYYADAASVAAETMRRARHNVEMLIQRLDRIGYRFLQTESAAQDQVSQVDLAGQLAAQMETRAALDPTRYNIHSLKMLEGFRAMKSRPVHQLERVIPSPRRPPLQDPQIFAPPDSKTARQLSKLEKAAGGALPLSLRAWYEEVGGVSLMGCHPVLNPVDFSNRRSSVRPDLPTADPLVVLQLQELLDQLPEESDEPGGHELQLVLSPDDLHKANLSGDAYYLMLPDTQADFCFGDWHNTTFVNYLRIAFEWGGFPGWARSLNPPRKEIALLSEGLLPL